MQSSKGVWERLTEHELSMSTLRNIVIRERMKPSGRYGTILRYRSIPPISIPVCTHAFHPQIKVRHGNQDTYREMLRVKRSVLAQYSTQVNLMSAEMLAASRGDDLLGAAASLRAAGAPEVCF